MAVDPQIRTLTRPRTRTRRRSACPRHPNEPITALCALCLRDRLAILDSSTDQIEAKHENIVSFPFSRRTRGSGDPSSSSGVVPELRRGKSVSVEKCEKLNGLILDLRRMSCDVRDSNRLTDLFHIDDTKITEPVLEIIEDNDDCSEIRVSDERFVQNEIADDDGDFEEDDDLRTMKEHIEMELQNKKRNFFSQKLLKWRQKYKEKKGNEICNDGIDNHRSKFRELKDPILQSEVADYGLGCDAAPRVSIDAHRMSLDEHRASWDGYMIARTIPRLTPMLPIVDNMMLPPVNKGILVKEGGSSSGASAKSNSDSSSSNTGTSSSSIKSISSKTAGFEGDDMKSVSKSRVSRANDVICQETKLVITERELKDWHLNSINNNVESTSNAPIKIGHKKETTRWQKVSNLWSYKYKLSEKKNCDSDSIQEKTTSMNRINEINGVERGNSSGNLVRNSSYVGSRNKTESHISVEEGGRYSMSDIDSGLLRLYLSPFAKSRKSKF